MSTPATKPSSRGHRGEGLVGIIIRDFPLDLKRRIAKVAEDQGTNAQDLVVSTLAAAKGVKYVAGGRRSSGLMDSNQMYFAVPRVLRRKLNQEAARRETFTRTIILELLNEKFGKTR